MATGGLQTVQYCLENFFWISDKKNEFSKRKEYGETYGMVTRRGAFP